MKKMDHSLTVTIIFILVLALLVAGGCKLMGPNGTTEETTTSDTASSSDKITDGTHPSGEDISEENTLSTSDSTHNQEIPVISDSTSNGGTEEKTTEMRAEQVTSDTDTTANTTPITPSKTEFDIIIGSSFYCKGTSTDENGQSNNMEIAITPNSVYMLSKFEGVDMGALVSDGTTYMIYPEKSAYLEFSPAVLKMIGLEDEQLVDTSKFGFEDIHSLSEAKSVEDVSFNGTVCKAYTFLRSENSKTVFYMNGTKLVGFVSSNADGSAPTTTVISYITDKVPQDKITPPSDYKAYKGVTGLMKFISVLGDVIN